MSSYILLDTRIYNGPQQVVMLRLSPQGALALATTLITEARARWDIEHQSDSSGLTGTIDVLVGGESRIIGEGE